MKKIMSCGIGRTADGTISYDIISDTKDGKSDLIMEFQFETLEQKITLKDITQNDIDELIGALKFVRSNVLK
jgi:hypothetical protein